MKTGYYRSMDDINDLKVAVKLYRQGQRQSCVGELSFGWQQKVDNQPKTKDILVFTEVHEEILSDLERVASKVLERDSQSLHTNLQKENIGFTNDSRSPWKLKESDFRTMKVKISHQPNNTNVRMNYEMLNTLIPTITQTLVTIKYYGDGGFSIAVKITNSQILMLMVNIIKLIVWASNLNIP